MLFSRLQLIFFVLLFTFSSYCFSQKDSAGTVNAWILEENGSTEPFEIDTTLYGSFQSYPWYYINYLAWNGNTWSPVYPLFFSPRYSDDGETKDWLKYYPAFNNNLFFNARKPFSLITFNNNAKKPLPEQNLEFLHTQNVMRWFNIGLSGNFAASTGNYQHQENRQNNFRIFSSFTSPGHTGYLSFNFGKAGIQENGGISDISMYSDSLLPPENIPVNLTMAANAVKYRTLLVKQEHIIAKAKEVDSTKLCYPWALSAGASFTMDRMRHLYTDVESGYYSNIYIDTTITSDSLQVSRYETSAYIKMDLCRKWGVYSGPFFERRDYGVLENHFRHDATGIKSGAYLKMSHLSVDITAIQHFSGQEILNHINSHLRYSFSDGKPTLSLEAFYTENHPRFYDTYYISNNFFWKNTFNDITDAGFRFGVEVPALHGGLNITAQQITNAVYYDSLAYPVQNPDAVMYSSAKAYLTIKTDHFRWTPQLLYQILSSDILPGVPAFITVQHFSYSNRIFKVLEIQAGTEIFYTTSFYGPSYMPATMVYYVQTELRTGDYPVADVFLNMKLKRVSFSFKIHHVNDRLMDRNNFLVAGYPLPDRHFTMGISWSFYN